MLRNIWNAIKVAVELLVVGVLSIGGFCLLVWFLYHYVTADVWTEDEIGIPAPWR